MASSQVRRLPTSRRDWTREIIYREDSTPIPSGTATVTAAVDHEPTPSASRVQVAQPLPTSTKALIGFFVVLGLTLVGIAIWRIGAWRRKQIRSRAASSQVLAGISTTKSIGKFQVIFDSKQSSEKSAYVMNLPIQPPPMAHSNNKAPKKGTSRWLGNLHFGRNKQPAPIAPPPYEATPIPTIVTPAPTAPQKYDMPIVNISGDDGFGKNARLTLNLARLDTQASPASPTPSPRTSSHGVLAPDSAWKTPATSIPSKALGAKQLPRLMIVTCTFVPSLPDELTIRVGESLRLLEEYEDEWCLVQRVGKPDAEKGVIPRFCLQERTEIMASLPKHKKGAASLGTAHVAGGFRH